jgi:FtsH-binding integral membrane protein
MLIGIDNAEIILDSCSRHKILFWLGFALVATASLAIGYALTRNDEIFKIPFWLIFVPTVVLLFYAGTIAQSLKQSWRNESIEHKLSGMNKKDFLGYKIGDDRASKSLGATALSSAVLSGSSILGPFLRADYRL